MNVLDFADAAAIQVELDHRGIRLTLDGDDIVYDGPPGAMTPDLLDALQHHKPTLLAMWRIADASPPPAEHWTSDPRPDLEGDGELWAGLLAHAYQVAACDPWGVFGILRALRCEGARLERDGDALHLVPPDGVTEYQLWAEWVGDQTHAVRNLLDRVTA